MAWVDFFRAFPPLVLLIFLFAGLPFAGLELGGFACVCIAFFLNTGAYYGEILRAGIESVPSGQTEAARSTGLGRVQTMLFVVLPQAVRNVLPDLLSNTLEVVKLTSLGSVVWSELPKISNWWSNRCSIGTIHPPVPSRNATRRFGCRSQMPPSTK